MTWRDILASAVRSLTSHRMRSLLTTLGIVVGVAAVVAMVAIGRGAQDRVQKQIESIGTNLLLVIPERAESNRGVSLTARVPTLTEADIAELARVPGVAGVASAVAIQAHLVHGNRDALGLVYGISPGYLERRSWVIEKGRAFSAGDFRDNRKVAVIGATTARDLFGARNPVGAQIRIASTPFTVIGLLAGKGSTVDERDQDEITLVPMKTAKARLVGGASLVRPDSVDFAFIQSTDPDLIEGIQNRAAALLRNRHRLATDEPDDFVIEDLAKLTNVYAENERSFAILLASIAFVSLLVGGISIANIMLVSVAERTREIGIRLAVGASPGDIRRQFLAEAGLIAMLGGVLGMMAGLLIAIGLAGWGQWDVIIDIPTAALSILLAVGVGVAAGYLPARKAATLDPMRSLRHD